MFISRFSRAEHVDTLVSWIEAQNQCLQNFALLSSQGLPPAILTSLETKLRFALAFWSDFSRCASEEEVLSVWKGRSSCIRCFEDCDFCVQMDVAAHGATKKSLIRSALKLRMTKTLAPRLAVVASI